MDKHRILLVEDDREISNYNRCELEHAGYCVDTAENLTQAKEKLETFCPDLMVLDILLPDGSGVDFCRQLRASSPLPVLFLTSLNDSTQIVNGLRSGGDDYIVKPYRFEELLARIEVSLRRLDMQKNIKVMGNHHILSMESRAMRAYIDGRDLNLKPKEYQILDYLAHNRNRYTMAQELYSEIWGMASNEDIRTILVHISHLRAKMSAGGGDGPFYIEKSRNKGYKLITENMEG